MFGPQFAALRFSAKTIARRTVWSAVGGIFLLTAFLFFGVALWIYFEGIYGALNTALGFGGVLLVLAIIAFAWARYPPRVIPKDSAHAMQNPMNSPALSTAALVNAVILGISAGRAARRRG